MSTSVPTRTVTLRVTPRHRSRLDILMSYMDINPSKFFADYIDSMWDKASQAGSLQSWLNDVSGIPAPQPAEPTDDHPSGKMKAVNL